MRHRRNTLAPITQRDRVTSFLTEHCISYMLPFMRHHTKDKGDQGLGFIISDLLKHNIQPALLLSEHLPFDCVAISEEGKMVRLSVKYRASKNGVIPVSLSSCWADRHGVHTKNPDLSSFDAIAVYCPDTQLIYYLRTLEMVGNSNFTIRILPPKNSQTKKVILGSALTDPKRIFNT